ncbi:MAG: helix-turn-helix transcriptional regulator [Vampirovibrionales bacterium]|nr:helix-turn-helix transcriptional regulator [Vampirovibrionales bacterium]
MKRSPTQLGQALQFFLLKQGISMEALAVEMRISPDSLSNLIHGRRRFKNDTLINLASCAIVRNGGLTLSKLRALRAMDDYTFEEILLALTEFIRMGAVESLPDNFFQQFQANLELGEYPPAFASKKNALLSLARSVGA